MKGDMDRRTFVYNAALGTLNLGLARPSAPATGLGAQVPENRRAGTRGAPSPLGMPGLFPGRVMDVQHSQSIVDRRVSQPAVRAMVDAGMKALTGESLPRNAWARFFALDRYRRHQGESIRGSRNRRRRFRSFAKSFRALNSAGVPSKHIIVYDRNSNQLEVNGYHVLVPSGVRVVGLD